MQHITKQVPTERYIQALIGSHTGHDRFPYAIIDDIDADIIRSSDGDYTQLCVIENHDWTQGFDMNPLPQLKQGLWRLWNLKDWETADNRRKASLKRNEELQASYQAKLDTIVDYYVSLNMPLESAKAIVKIMTPDMVAQLLPTIPTKK